MSSNVVYRNRDTFEQENWLISGVKYTFAAIGLGLTALWLYFWLLLVVLMLLIIDAVPPLLVALVVYWLFFR